MSYTLKIEHNGVTDEYYVPLPEELLNKLGWVEGNDITWKTQDNGSFLLTKSPCSSTTTHGASEAHETVTINYTAGNSESIYQDNI